MLDHETFDVQGRWEKDRGPQQLSYDFFWHLGQDTMITSEWGTPNMVKDGVNPELLLGGKYGHALHVWDLRRRTHLEKLDLGAEHQMALELTAGPQPDARPTASSGWSSPWRTSPVRVFLWYREQANGEVGGAEGHRDPRRPGRRG